MDGVLVDYAAENNEVAVLEIISTSCMCVVALFVVVLSTVLKFEGLKGKPFRVIFIIGPSWSNYC